MASTLLATEALQQGEFDLLILDLGSSGEHELDRLSNGLALAAGLPVLVLTGSDPDRIESECLRKGVLCTLSKTSLNAVTLQRAARCAIDRHAIGQGVREANEKLHDFAFRASHDLKAPLRRVRALLGFIEEELGGDCSQSVRDYVSRMEAQLESMRCLVDSLVTFASAGSKPLCPVSVELEQALDEALQNLEPLLKASSVKINRGQLPRVRADKVGLVTLFQNLIENCVKFAGEEAPVIQLDSTVSESQCEVTVRDNGIGVAPCDLAGLFQPFARLGTKTGVPGAGMGLYLCRSIADRHGGSIWATSEGPGRGTAVHVRLPLENAGS